MLLIVVLGFMSFSAATVLRLADPVVPLIARDFSMSVETAALVASAFALPYALGQPILGPLGDALGKVRVIKVCLGVSLLALVVCLLAPTYSILFFGRVLGGLAAGGILPIAIAMIGDRYEFAERQVALSRLIFATITGQLAGAIVGGAIGEMWGWRAPFVAALGLNIVGFLLSLAFLKPLTEHRPEVLRFSTARNNYIAILSNPLAIVCYGGVFAEGVFIYGVFPHIASILEARGTGGVHEAGYVIAGFAIGGILYTASIRTVLARIGMIGILRFGGALCAIAFALMTFVESWQALTALFILNGVGFYLMHSSFQTQATELAPHARGSAVALHAFFFFLGIALGPALFGVGMLTLGLTMTLAICAFGCITIGLTGAAAMAARTRLQPRPR